MKRERDDTRQPERQGDARALQHCPNHEEERSERVEALDQAAEKLSCWHGAVEVMRECCEDCRRDREMA
ncbi:MAG: hypothetical protein ABI625_00105 [bacterium]